MKELIINEPNLENIKIKLIEHLVTTRAAHTNAELAAMLGVAERTIYRYALKYRLTNASSIKIEKAKRLLKDIGYDIIKQESI